MFVFKVLLCAAFAPRGDDPAKLVPLFNGRDLSGWRAIGSKPDVWSVRDGILTHRGEGGGWLATERDYADFELLVEFRLAPGANSGVYLRAPADGSHISRTGMEIQILDDDHPKYKGIKPWQFTGAIYHVAAPERGHLKPAGEWNSLRIVAEGPRIRIVLNGATVVDDRIDRHPELEAEHTGLKRREGRIGLQSHDGKVEFRKVGIRPIQAPSR